MEQPMPRKPRVPPRIRGVPWPAPGRAIGQEEEAPLGFAIRPDGNQEQARALFEAQIAYQQRRLGRQQTLVALALSSILPWVSMAWPHLVPPPVRNLAFIAWCGLLLVTAAVGGSELRWRRRMLRCADGLGAGSQRH